ncbi:CidA/LrgA family protein [Vibrio maerlii]|uniref:CidA/LrgA family protein n=1 Tax=Vibrio maerlii TaxID=2231648 RepID=UPI000E3DBD39|nr:CidA/LrgA family protein [Vibrio maerlii]
MVKTFFNYITSFALIWLSLFIGQAIQALLGISIPGSIIGMLILFSLLTSGLVKVEWVKPGASLFIRYMILLFVPISTGLMNHFELLISNALPIVASVVGGTLLVMVILGLWLERFLTGANK